MERCTIQPLPIIFGVRMRNAVKHRVKLAHVSDALLAREPTANLGRKKQLILAETLNQSYVSVNPHPCIVSAQ